MKNQKSIRDPTGFFIKQSRQSSNKYSEEINKFRRNLIDLDKCIVCREEYNLKKRTARILVHCGHTVCQACIKLSYKNQLIICPICQKVIKKIMKLDRLPINNEIWEKIQAAENPDFFKTKVNEHQLTDEINLRTLQEQQEILQQKLMNNQLKTNQTPFFEQQMQSHEEQMVMQEQKHQNQEAFDKFDQFLQKRSTHVEEEEEQFQQQMEIDGDEGDFCSIHQNEQKHFFCINDRTVNCELCCQEKYKDPNTQLVDLYQIEDLEGFFKELENYQIPESNI